MCIISQNHSEDENIVVKKKVNKCHKMLVHSNKEILTIIFLGININDNICQFLPTQKSLYIPYTRTTQPVARGQHIARDTVLCCLRRYLKRENVL